jgi:hypothetical protein
VGICTLTLPVALRIFRTLVLVFGMFPVHHA